MGTQNLNSYILIPKAQFSIKFLPAFRLNERTKPSLANRIHSYPITSKHTVWSQLKLKLKTWARVHWSQYLMLKCCAFGSNIQEIELYVPIFYQDGMFRDSWIWLVRNLVTFRKHKKRAVIAYCSQRHSLLLNCCLLFVQISEPKLLWPIVSIHIQSHPNILSIGIKI